MFLYPQWTGDYGIFSHFGKKAGVYPVLNLAYLGALAEELGHEVKIIDGQVEKLSCKKMVDKVVDFDPDLIGMTATTPFFHFVEETAIAIKKKLPYTPILLGGPHITVLKEEAFKDCFDYGFIGEADVSFPEFLKKYDSGTFDIKGILYRVGNKVKYNGDANFVTDINALPRPARHLLKTDRYKLGTLSGVKNFATVMTTRGCPFRCIFCSTKVFGNKVRKRSPRLVVDEIKHIKKKYNINHFMILDDTLTLDRKHILEICDLIIKENMNITFEGGTRANLLDEELVSKLKKAGMIRISFGLESVDEKIRKTMRKEVPLESYIEANKLTNKYGIETLNSCMIGLPGETKNTIKKTLSFLRDSHDIKQANLSIAVPYPGTELYHMAKKETHGLKLIIDNFSKFRRYNCAVMQVGNLSPEELIKLQNDAFASIYLAYWRWIPVLKKSGLFGLFLTFTRLLKSVARGRLDLILVDKNYWKEIE